ncbi:hypothetical protein [Bacillus mobilis]|uniref:hypothetical protein n=1 Tax=Bacillus mobilis TaxID=2026190 RepID=UPI0037CA6D87
MRKRIALRTPKFLMKNDASADKEHANYLKQREDRAQLIAWMRERINGTQP